MVNKLILSILLCFGLTSVCADEIDNKKMREAVRRVLQFVDVNYSIETVEKIPNYDENSEFGELSALTDTYKLNKNVWYLGKVPTQYSEKSVEECQKNSEKTHPLYEDCIDAFAVEVIYMLCSGNACDNQDIWLSSPKYNTEASIILDEKETSLSNRIKGKYFEFQQIKKPPYPEFIVTSYAVGDRDSFHFPTLKYQQKFRFNNKTGKFEEIGKAKFLGKIQYCNNKIIPISQECKD